MASPEISNVSAEVNSLKQEVVDTKTQLERIKSEGSVWSAEGRESIVRKCMEAIEPKMSQYVAKFNSIADTLKKLGTVDEITPIKTEFSNLLSVIESALLSMESHGNAVDKAKAKNLCSLIRSCQSKIG